MSLPSIREPYVGTGFDGCQRSAQIDREEADGYDADDPRRANALASAERWDDQARAELVEGLTSCLATTELSIEHLSKTLLAYEHLRLSDSLLLLRRLREARIALAEIEASVEAKCAGLMDDDTFEVPGVLYAQRKGGAKRSAWDRDSMNARILHAVSQEVALDTATGEVDDALAMAAAEAVEKVQQLARLEYRTGALKKQGIAYDDLCTTEWGRRTVIVSDAPVKDGDDG